MREKKRERKNKKIFLTKLKDNSYTGKERGDIEIKDYVVLLKPQEQDNRPPSRTLIMDFTIHMLVKGRDQD